MNKALLSILSIALKDKKNVRLKIDSFDWDEIVKKAKRHNVLAALYIGCKKLSDDQKPDNDTMLFLEQNYYLETRKSILQLFEVDKIRKYFELNGIYNLAMKGCITKHRYPNDVLRSMGDIDMLIKSEQNSRINNLMRDLGYSGFVEGRKHDHYLNDSNLGVEMHRDLVASENENYDYYSDIWNRLSLIDDSDYSYEMTIEDEYIYNIVHLIQHFKLGGIGIRFIMDIYVYNHYCDMDNDYLDKEFKKLGVKAFTDNLVKLADGWFDGKRFPDDDREMLNKLSRYIIEGGTFGSSHNASALQTSKGKNTYLLRFCFPKYNSMVSLYPWLKSKPYLLPYAWIHRGVKALLFRRGNIKTVTNIYKNADKNESQKLLKFYNECGLE